MLSYKSFTIITLLTGIPLAVALTIRDLSSYPSACTPSCSKADAALNVCIQATPAGFNATKDIVADVNFLACTCTNSLALSTGTCTSCSSIFGSTAYYNKDDLNYIDGSFLMSFNSGCQIFASKVLNQTWTNTTYTYGGGLNGPGAAIPSFAPTPVPSPSATPKAAGGERLMISATTTIGLFGLGIFGLVF